MITLSNLLQRTDRQSDPNGIEPEAFYGCRGFERFGTCGTHIGDAGGYGQCERIDPGFDEAI